MTRAGTGGMAPADPRPGTVARVRFTAPAGLPRVYSPPEAAEILRGLGLAEMTECALRTRAYRKQVPFHLNGRRITFTLDDLREIVEGDARRPQPRAQAPGRAPQPTPPLMRRSPRPKPVQRGPWRARQQAILLVGGDRPGRW